MLLFPVSPVSRCGHFSRAIHELGDGRRVQTHVLLQSSCFFTTSTGFLQGGETLQGKGGLWMRKYSHIDVKLGPAYPPASNNEKRQQHGALGNVN